MRFAYCLAVAAVAALAVSAEARADTVFSTLGPGNSYNANSGEAS